MASAAEPPSRSGDGELLERVRAYWEAHVSDWKVAKSPPGSREFFAETEAYRFEKLHYLPKVVDFSGFAGKDLLDVGCGLGNDTARFAAGGARVTGIDLAARAVDLARQNFAQRGLTGRFEVMNGEAMTFPDDCFDVVYCHTVLHFTPSPDAMVREIRRVLRPGGIAILMTVNRNSWLFALQKVMKVEIDYSDSPVFRRYPIAEFRRMLAVFGDVKIVPERFPVETLVHKGVKARLFNLLFVGAFNLLPQRFTRDTGHHLLAFCREQSHAT
jgi:ubiquinone/menaquinone biosynthesis C-methylase UbiE